jgi:Delta24-sterol reductase
MYRALQETNTGQEYIIQDVCVPEEHLTELLDFIHNNLKIFPLWLLPITPEAFKTTNIRTKKNFIVNVGIWSASNLPYDKFVAANIDIEEKVAELGGCKIPYGHFYGSEALFWKNFNKKTYEDLRIKYNATGVFPSIYDKLHVGDRYTPTVKKGFFRALRPRWRLPLT